MRPSVLALAQTSAFLASLIVGCGGASTSQVRGTQIPEGGLALLVPEEATEVWVFRPAEILQSPAFMALLGPLISTDGRAKLEARLGAALDDFQEVVVADSDEGRLIVVRGNIDAHAMVEKAGERMTDVERKRGPPFTYRRGHIGAHLWDISAARDDMLVATRARGERTSPPPRPLALATDADGSPFDVPSIEALRATHSPAPVAGYILHPISTAEASNAALLLSRQRALAMSISPLDISRLRLSVSLLGAFPPGAVENFRAWVGSIAQSPFGLMLGLHKALESFEVVAPHDDRIDLDLSINADHLGEGLRRMFVASIKELLNN